MSSDCHMTLLRSSMARRYPPEDDFPFAWIMQIDHEGNARELKALPDGLNTIDGTLWVHLKRADLRAMRWLREQSSVPASVKDVLLSQEDEEPYLSGREDYICGVLRDFTQELGGAGEDVSRICFYVTESLIITARRQPVRASIKARRAIEQSQAVIQRPLDIFQLLLEKIVDGFEVRIEQLWSNLDRIEDHVLDDHTHDDRHQLGQIRRSAATVHRLISSNHRAVLKMLKLPQLYMQTREILQHMAHHLENVTHESSSIQDRARLLHEELNAQLADETNRQLYILTILGTLIMPPTLISGMFGMNLKGVPFADDENGFWMAFLTCLLSSALTYAIVWISSRKNA